MKANYFELEDNVIDPTAIIEPGAIIGKGNTIGAYTVIRACVKIGNNNYIAPHVVIGEPAEYRVHPKRTFDEKVIIGNRNRISEFVSIQAGILSECTFIIDNCYIMHGCHIAHDNHICSDVTIAPLTTLGGMVIVEPGANIGMGVLVHPRLKIEMGAMVGMGAVVTKNIPEFETWAGVPAKYMKPNQKAIDKYETNK